MHEHIRSVLQTPARVPLYLPQLRLPTSSVQEREEGFADDEQLFTRKLGVPRYVCLSAHYRDPSRWSSLGRQMLEIAWAQPAISIRAFGHPRLIDCMCQRCLRTLATGINHC